MPMPASRLAAGALPTLLLAACTTPPPAEPAPEPTPVAGEGCDARGAQRHVGHVADAATVEAARVEAGARSTRTIAPGQMVTMDYRGDRLNLHVDGSRRITRLTCG